MLTASVTQRILWVLWPSFLVAAVAELLVFAVIDPADLHVFGVPVEAGRMPIYTMGFFFFWALGAAASALTVFLQRSPVEVNRCPLGADDRPAGCPKRPDDFDVDRSASDEEALATLASATSRDVAAASAARRAGPGPT